MSMQPLLNRIIPLCIPLCIPVQGIGIAMYIFGMIMFRITNIEKHLFRDHLNNGGSVDKYRRNHGRKRPSKSPKSWELGRTPSANACPIPWSSIWQLIDVDCLQLTHNIHNLTAVFCAMLRWLFWSPFSFWQKKKPKFWIHWSGWFWM